MSEILVLTVNPSGKTSYRRDFEHRIDFFKCNVVGAFPGAWKLTKRYNERGGPNLEDIREQIRRKAIYHRDTIKGRLECMNAKRATELKPTQYKSFYNFLTTLK